MPRLFTGIEIPQSQRMQLSLLQSGIKDVRWIEPSDFHITLRFFGDVSVKIANDLVEALSSRAWQAPLIQLGELHAFGGSKPRAIYASVNNNGPLNTLAQAHDRLAQTIGLPTEGRKFTPHVTLCRVRGAARTQSVAHYLSNHGGLSYPAFRPARFVLYSAKDSTGGGPYRIEQSWNFSNPVS